MLNNNINNVYNLSVSHNIYTRSIIANGYQVFQPQDIKMTDKITINNTGPNANGKYIFPDNNCPPPTWLNRTGVALWSSTWGQLTIADAFGFNRPDWGNDNPASAVNYWGSSGYSGPYQTNYAQDPVLYVIGNIKGTAVYAGSTQLTSDIRLKKNIISINPIDALNIIKQIQLKRYDFIDDILFDVKNLQEWGIIAQEIESIIPSCITKMKLIIPNIMYLSTNIIKEKQANDTYIYTITLDKNYNIPNNVLIRITNCWDKNKQIIYEDIECTVISDTTISVQLINHSFSKLESLFVYGFEVNDACYVDKIEVLMPLIGAVQELDNQNITMQQQMTLLQEQNTTMQQQLLTMQQQMAIMQEQLNKLLSNN
jgi:hypothetical protein